MVATARPLNMEPPFVFTLITAEVAFTPGFHPETVPSSVTNRKMAGFPGASWKSWLPLKICPVGLPVWLLLSPGGIVTTRGMAVPVPVYNVVTPVPLSETHHGLPELRDMPHGFTRLESVTAAIPGMFETRFVCL